MGDSSIKRKYLEMFKVFRLSCTCASCTWTACLVSSVDLQDMPVRLVSTSIRPALRDIVIRLKSVLSQSWATMLYLRDVL